MNETTTETDTMAPGAPYDADMHCRKIAWMVKHSPDWDYETQTLEQYLETVPEYPLMSKSKALTICGWNLSCLLKRMYHTKENKPNEASQSL